MLDHAFTSLGLHRVALSVFEFNERAIRSYRPCGFVVEGRAREAIWRDGRCWDEIHMSVLAPEWRAARWQARAIADGRAPAPVDVAERPTIPAQMAWARRSGRGARDGPCPPQWRGPALPVAGASPHRGGI